MEFYNLWTRLHLIRLKDIKNYTSRLVFPVFQEWENPSKIRSWSIGATIKSPKFIVHFFGPVSAPKTLAPRVCMKKIATPKYWKIKVIRKYFSCLLIHILTLNRSRRAAWRGNPVSSSNMMVNISDSSPISSVTTPIERKSPIREFLLMQKKILSMIFCRSPMSSMEPWEPDDFLERRLDPLRSGLWINMKSQRFILYNFISHQRFHLHTLGIRIVRKIFLIMMFLLSLYLLLLLMLL